MIIQCDTRQKKKHHTLKENYFKSQGHELKHFGMVVGDYQILGKGNIVVDTKKDIAELYGNLVQDHDRFHRECVLAQQSGIKLYILVENKSGVTSLKNFKKWVNPQQYRYFQKCRELTGVRSGKDNFGKNNFYQVFHVAKQKSIKLPKPPMENSALVKAMETMQSEYDVTFLFCKPEESGKRVLELLMEKEKGE